MRVKATILLIFYWVMILMVGQIRAESSSVIIHSEQWDIPRHGEILIKQPELGKIVRSWASQPGSHIEIRYPGGEGGEIWVQELMDWLIALGVPSDAILHSLGSGGEDIIKLVLNSKQVKGNTVDE